MKSRAEIEAQLRQDNPTSDGNGSGHPDYEALIDRWTDAALAAQADVVPKEVSRRQLLLVLASLDPPITRDAIRAMLTGDELALIEFDEARSFARNHPLLESLASQMGMTSEQVDELFITAATL